MSYGDESVILSADTRKSMASELRRITSKTEQALLEMLAHASYGPPDRRFWIMPHTDREGPSYPVKVAASVFFARSQTWLRSMEYDNDPRYPQGRLILDGKPIQFSRDARGARLFFLHDIEPMAHSLHGFGALDDERRDRAIQTALLIAVQHKVLETI